MQGGFPKLENERYLQFLSKYCKKNNIIFFLDEIITGIRVNCSSVQNTLKLNSSISKFGKVMGGGAPLGVIGI